MRRSALQNPNSDLNPTQNLRSRRRIRNPETRLSFPAVGPQRPRRNGFGSGRKFVEADPPTNPPPESGGAPRRKSNDANGAAPSPVSARKLAAAIWHARFQEEGGGGGVEPAKPFIGHIHLRRGLKCRFNPKNGFFHKFESSLVLPNPSMEKATKWDAECSKPLDEFYQSFDLSKLLVDVPMIKSSVLENKLQAELDEARARITVLEAKRDSSKKELKHFLKKHAEEKELWRAHEHRKIRAVIERMTGDLNIQRKNRRRTEILNSKLVDELAEAKKSAKQSLQDYEKERKARELVEEICDELAKEAGEDRTDFEAMKRESERLREEVEEERKMLQMAEVWREERVQMKLIDAKLALENQYSQLKELQGELESFLSSRSQTNTNLDVGEIKEAELLLKATAESVKHRGMEVFTYKTPPASEDIFSIFEEIQQQREETKPCYGSSPESNASEEQALSPATDIFLEKPANGSIEDDSGWETLSRDEGLGSSNSPEGSDDGSNSEISEDSGKKASSISSLWKAPCPNGGMGFSPTSLDQWSSAESVNSRTNRGMKGCIEWPRGAQKHSLKAKLLEARLEGNRVQIRHVLKQKI